MALAVPLVKDILSDHNADMSRVQRLDALREAKTRVVEELTKQGVYRFQVGCCQAAAVQLLSNAWLSVSFATHNQRALRDCTQLYFSTLKQDHINSLISTRVSKIAWSYWAVSCFPHVEGSVCAKLASGMPNIPLGLDQA